MDHSNTCPKQNRQSFGIGNLFLYSLQR